MIEYVRNVAKGYISNHTERIKTNTFLKKCKWESEASLSRDVLRKLHFQSTNISSFMKEYMSDLLLQKENIIRFNLKLNDQYKMKQVFY